MQPARDNTKGELVETLDAALAHATGDSRVEFRALDSETMVTWRRVVESASFAPVYFEPFWIDYQIKLQYDRSVSFVPACQIITYSGKPVAVWLLALSQKPDGWHCEGLYGHVREPLFSADVSKRVARRIATVVFDALLEIHRRFQCRPIEVLHQNWITAEPGPLHRVIAEAGYKTDVGYAAIADLDRPWADVWGSVRRRYRDYINAAAKSFEFSVVDGDNPDKDEFDRFEQLHIEVAGRRTRPHETWESQWRGVVDGGSMLITMRKNGSLYGGGLFSHNRHFAEYWVGVFRRDVSDAPYIGHAVLGNAMRRLHETGVRLFYIGERHYAGDTYWPYGDAGNERWENIADFKAGFANRYAFVFFHQLGSTG